MVILDIAYPNIGLTSTFSSSLTASSVAVEKQKTLVSTNIGLNNFPFISHNFKLCSLNAYREANQKIHVGSDFSPSLILKPCPEILVPSSPTHGRTSS